MILHRRNPSFSGPRAAAAALLSAVLAVGVGHALDMKPQEVQARYRAVLATLSAGAEEEALEELYALETAAVPEYAGPVALERFWRLKLRVIRELLQNGKLDQLVPIIVLHHDAFEMYRQREEPLLAVHSRTMASELAQILANRAADDGQVQTFVGWVLASFGVYMQESRSISGSAEIFREALSYSPGNRQALLGLAAAHEKYGEYEEALPHLQRAISLDPADYHARLRMALCMARAGQADTARGHLQRLTAEGIPDWIRSLAFQELAILQQRGGLTAEAETTLWRAVESLPSHQQPRVQLASMLELSGRPAEAQALLAEVRPTPPDEHSPRYRYDQWPAEGVAEARSELRVMMNDRLYLLSAALGALPTTEAGP